MRKCLFFCVLGLYWGSIAGCVDPRSVRDDVLRVAIEREPLTWNRLLADELLTHVVTDQLHSPLLRLNPQTQQMEPALARSWAYSDDDTSLELTLRDGVKFSDGHPFTAADVVFTFQVLADAATGSPLADSARIDGEILTPQVVDELTIRFPLPRRTATLERVLDSIPILPRHALERSLERGSLAADTGLGAEAESVVGLGPFRLVEHVPGERIVVERNPYYYRSTGAEIWPRLAGIVFDVVPDQNAQRLRLLAGDVDLLVRTPSDTFVALTDVDERAFDGGGAVVARDLGPGLHSERLWFNLNPDSPIESRKKGWFADLRFRRAVSLAIDRASMASVVFSGLASPAIGPTSIGNRFWINPDLAPFVNDTDRARALLAEAGFTLRDGMLVDASGQPVRFSVSTTAGNTQRSRQVAFIQEDLSALGIEVVASAIEGGALLSRVTRSFDYDAGLLGFSLTDPDPSAEAALWSSAGPLHLWHPLQAQPATPWEARLDTIMEQQAVTTDHDKRVALHHELQRIVVEHLPVLDLVVPHVLVAHRREVQHLRPSPFSHVLWNADEIEVERREKAPK